MISTDLSKLIVDEVEKQLSPEALQEKIEENVKKLVDKLMNNEVFGDWGIVYKAAKEMIDEKMNVKFNTFNLVPLCEAITNQFQSHIAHWDETERVEALKTMADIILGKAPKEMKLSEICEMIKSEYGSDDECACYNYKDIRYIKIEMSERNYGSKDIILTWKDKYDSDFKLEAMHSSSGHLFYIRFNGEQIKKSIEMKDVDGWLGTLLACQEHDVNIPLDLDDGDTFALEEVVD